MFETLHGNEPIKSYLRRALEEEQLPHSLLFSGPEGVGKSRFAKELASHLLRSPLSRIESENHPDLHLIRPEGKSGLHAIENIRILIDQVHEAPYQAPRKVFILFDAERMQPASANALLKTLEEPNLDTTLILLTSLPQEILPTILSRCIKLVFQPLPEEAIASILQSLGHLAHFAKLAHGSASTALLMAADSTLAEMRKALFSLLAKPIFYPDLFDVLEKLEADLSTLKEEDPVAYHQRVHLLFSLLLMWARDQHARRMNLPLFFPEEPASALPLLPLHAVERLLNKARAGVERNIKLSVCLENFFLSI